MTEIERDEGPDLEKRLDRLEEIVEALEGEELELDEALQLFEEGVGHIRATRKTLEEAELRVERLLDDGDGGSILEPEQVEAKG